MASNDVAVDVNECPVCHDVFNTDANLPKVFPCGHSLCAVCVPACISQGRGTCPMCRQETPVPPNGLPTNFKLREVIESAEAARILADVKCSACHKNVPSSEGFACKTCSVDVMVSCCALCTVEAHWGHLVFKHDTLVSREQIDAVADKRRAYSDDYQRRAAAVNVLIKSARNTLRANPYAGEEFTFPSFLTKEEYERRMSESSHQNSMNGVFDDIERVLANFRQDEMRIRATEPQPPTSQVRQAAASSAGKRVVVDSESENYKEESFSSRAQSRNPTYPKRCKYC